MRQGAPSQTVRMVTHLVSEPGSPASWRGAPYTRCAYALVPTRLRDNCLLIYITGRGYSGSTLVEAWLAQASNAFALGEVVSGWLRYDGICACGQKIGECEEWDQIRRQFEKQALTTWDDAGRVIYKASHLRSYLSTLFRPRARRWLYVNRLNEALVAAVNTATSASIIIDSSKEPTRALQLAASEDSFILHLTRDPRAVASSYLSRSQQGFPTKILRKRFRIRNRILISVFAALSWSIGNVLSEIACRRASPRTCHLRFEDLLADPYAVRDRVSSYLTQHGLEPVYAPRGTHNELQVKFRHQIAGNRVRTSGQTAIRSTESAVQDFGLSRFEHLIVRSLTTFPGWRYGYYRGRARGA